MKPNPEPPNVILILADDLGYGELGCYGQTRVRTPFLDRLADQGARFTQFYSGAPSSAASRAVLLTGKDTGHSRIRSDQSPPLSPAEVNLAKVLAKAGARTGAFGNWFLGGEGSPGVPISVGFQEWVGFLDPGHSLQHYPSYLWRNEQKFYIPQNQGGQKGLYADDLFLRSSLNFIGLNRTNSFLVYLAPTLIQGNKELGLAGMEVPSLGIYSAQNWPEPEKRKAAMISRLDGMVGAVLNLLRRYGLEENTLVIFTSDNGPHHDGGVDPGFFKSAGNLRGGKADLYEGGIRVPFIVWWPGHVKPGVTETAPLGFVDLLPTLAEIVGHPKPAGLDGISFAPLLQGFPQKIERDFLYWETHEGGSKQALRMGDWKAIRPAVGKPLELYNLKLDPGESTNVALANPANVARAEGFLKTARTDAEHWPLK